MSIIRLANPAEPMLSANNASILAIAVGSGLILIQGLPGVGFYKRLVCDFQLASWFI
jgi:hypothetical protein